MFTRARIRTWLSLLLVIFKITINSTTLPRNVRFLRVRVALWTTGGSSRNSRGVKVPTAKHILYRKKRLTPYLDRWRYKIQSAGIRQSAGRHGQHVRLVTDGMDKIQPINDKGQACNAYIAARLSTKQTWEHGRGSNWLLLYRQQPRRCFIFQLTTFAQLKREKKRRRRRSRQR